MGDSERNKTAVRDFYGAATHGDTGVLDAIVSPDYVLHDPLMGEVHGLDGAKAVIESYRAGLAGLRVEIEQQLTDGDYVVTRYTARGTHEGDILGVPPTGRQVAVWGIAISRCRDGVVEEEWELCDVFGLLHQVGALPEPVAG